MSMQNPQCAPSSAAVYYHKIRVENIRVAWAIGSYTHTKNPSQRPLR